MKLNKIIQDLKIYINDYEELVLDPKEDERYKYAVSMLGYLEELKHLRTVNKNISRELITRTDNLNKANIEAQKYFNLLMEDEQVIYYLAEAIYDDDGSWNMHNKYNIEEIIEYFRKKCENEYKRNTR